MTLRISLHYRGFVESILSDEDTATLPTKPHPDIQKTTDFQNDLHEARQLSKRRPTPFIPRPRGGLLSQQIPGPIPTEKTRRETKPRRTSPIQPRATIKEHTTEYSTAEDANIKSPRCQPCSQNQDNGAHGIEEHTSPYSEPRVDTQSKAENETSSGVTEIRPIELNRLGEFIVFYVVR